MAESVAGRDDPQSGREQILLVMREGRDRTLLREWIEAQPTYESVISDPGGQLPAPDEYDLCIVDTVGLERSYRTLAAHQDETEPVFRPTLLITPKETTEVAAAQFSGDQVTIERLISDIVSMPVDQGVLQRRIENLLQARRASVRLREREQQYEQLVDLTPEALLIVRDREIVFSNAAATDVFTPGSETADALDGRSVMALITDGDHSAFTTVLDTIKREGSTEAFQAVTMQTVSGDVVQAEIAGARIRFGEGPATQLLIRDVTAEYEREQRLTLFGRAIETAAQGVTIADAQQEDTPLIYANAAFEQITGYSAGEVLGRNCRFLQGEGTDPATVTRMREAIEDARPVTVDVLNYRKDGTPFWNQVDIVPVSNDEGTVTHFLGLQRDVTARKAREERLQVLGRVLRHNLRNRMNLILGYASQLQADDGADVVEAATTIEGAAESLLSISEHINEFTSIIDQHHETMETFDVVSVLESAVEGFRLEHPEASVSVECPEMAMVRGHHLLRAALGEVLTLTVGEDGSASELEVVVTRGEEWVTIELQDIGGTISEMELEILRQERETATEHPEGLELWLIRWAVLSSDGELRVTDDEPATIVLRLHRGEASTN